MTMQRQTMIRAASCQLHTSEAGTCKDAEVGHMMRKLLCHQQFRHAHVLRTTNSQIQGIQKHQRMATSRYTETRPSIEKRPRDSTEGCCSHKQAPHATSYLCPSSEDVTSMLASRHFDHTCTCISKPPQNQLFAPLPQQNCAVSRTQSSHSKEPT